MEIPSVAVAHGGANLYTGETQSKSQKFQYESVKE